ncbi:MAG: NADH-quinone oxidoreductase subunit A [Bdellovibrionales bacterium]|nr:NADH-quinone oxidoreductase subunit A [Bdellovibrionales bacterium]MBL7686744.1 NADH-quinone oxidoreductase subunit A [Pseudobdellovibrionaceae bacterium]
MTNSGALLPVIILAALVLVFGVIIVFGTGLLGPKNTSKDPASQKVKNMPYECGLPGTEMADTKISIKFYLTAILFILFDIEIIFMYPWAIKFLDSIQDGTGGYMLGVMGVFVLLFVVGLIWEVKSKALDWN